MPCPQPQILQKLLDETLSADQHEPIQAHLEECADCQKTLERLAAGGVTWDKTAQNLSEKPTPDEAALGDALAKLQEVPTCASNTHAESPVAPVDEELTFLQPPQRPGSLGRLDEYEILSVVGKGGFGIVLKAFDENLHRVVAIKVMSPQMAASGTARQRFIREAQAAAAVTHENVVTIRAVKKDAKIPYLVMQFVSGMTLNEKIDTAGTLGVKEILRMGMQIAEGLAAAHKQGLVHRDIKPGNILLENGIERVKITDFGLARAVDDASITQSGVVAGTPMYMSPEQANGEPVDHRSDLFSLGSVLYAMCTGHPPFRAKTTMAVLKRVCDDAPTPVQQVNADIPGWLSDVIGKLHAKKPEERFHTAKEVAELLGQQLAHLQQPTQSSRPEPLSPPIKALTPKRRRTPVVVGLLALLLGVGGTIWAGPTAIRYFGNRGEVEIIPDPGWVSVIVHKDGDAVTDWFDVGKRPTIQLPPGKYTFPPGFGPGRTLVHWEVTFHGLLFSHTLLQFNREPVFEVARGERVTLRAVMRDEPTPPPPPEEPGWVQLFNGKDLTGWRSPSTEKFVAWKVKDGAIVGKSDALGGFYQLYSIRDDYDNFHLRVEAKISPRAIAGVWFRSQPPPANKGYWAMIDADPDNGTVNIGLRRDWGPDGGSAILGPAAKAPAGDVEKWFTLEVIAQGPEIIIKVDGKVTSRVTDAAYAKGLISFDVGGGDHPVAFRKIEIKELPGPEEPAVRAERVRTLKALGVAFAAYHEVHGKAPADAAALKPFFDGDEKIWQALNDNSLVFFFSVGFRQMLLGTSNTVLAFDTRTPASGGHVLMADGSVRYVQPAQFTKLALARPRSESGWVQLFNGKDLTGWKYHPNLPGAWKVQDGVLTSGGPLNYLLSEGSDFANFHLRAQVSINPKGYSGILFHAGSDLETVTWGNASWPRPKGAREALISGGFGLSYTGSLFGKNQVKATEDYVRPDEWFELEVIATADRIIIKINGNTTADFTGGAGPLGIGHIALQQHTPETVVRFKKIEIKDLTPPPSAKKSEPGWVQLFNGKDLTGWKAIGHNGWSAKDGILIGNGIKETPGFLMTEREFTSYELELEVKLAAKTDTGVFLRAWAGGNVVGNQFPELQLIDSGGYPGLLTPNRDHGALLNMAAPKPPPAAKLGEWLPVRVRVEGTRVQVWLSGVQVIDHAATPFLSRGSIGLQLQIGRAEFRNLRVRDLPTPPEPGWVPLFNGKDLTGWKTLPGQQSQWRAADGMIQGSGPFNTNLFTERGDFADFHLRLEARLNKKEDSGVFLRVPYRNLAGTAAYEANLMVGDKLFPTGSLWGYKKADPNVKLPLIDEWFAVEVIAIGSHIVIKVNGKTTVDYVDPKSTFRRGHLALQHCVGDGVQFRSIKIKELPPEEPGWIQLFNGKDLSLWDNTAPHHWTVKDKILTGQLAADQKNRVTVWTKRQDYGDFHLRIEAKLNPGSSTIVFGRVLPKDLPWKGYNVTINRDLGNTLTGALWDLDSKQKLATAFKTTLGPDAWFRLEFIAQGPRFTVKVDGKVVTDELDPQAAANLARGAIGISLKPGGAMQVRKIEIKELPPSEPGWVQFFNGKVRGLAISPNGKLAAVGLVGPVDDTRLLDLATGKQPRPLEMPTPLGLAATAVCFSPDSKRLAGGAGQGVNAFIWDADTGKLLHTLHRHTDSVNGIAFLPDGKYLLTASRDQSLRVWNAQTGKELPLRYAKLPAVDWSALAVVPGTDQVIVGGVDKLALMKIILADPPTGPDGPHWSFRIEKEFPWTAGRVHALSLSADGKRLLTMDVDGRTRLFDVAAPKLIREFGVPPPPKSTWVHNALLPDGKRCLVATYSAEGAAAATLALWDVDTGKVLYTFAGHTGGINVVAVAPNGKQALSGGIDGSVRLWNLPEPGQAKPIFEEHFKNPVAKWYVGQDHWFKSGFEDDRYFMDLKPAYTIFANVTRTRVEGDFVCEAVGRVVGGPRSAWALRLHNVTSKYSLDFKLNGKQELEIVTTEGEPKTIQRIRLAKYPAIKPGTDFNTLRIVRRAGRYEVYVNGVAAGEPFVSDFVKLPAMMCLAAFAADDKACRAEFERLSIWSVESHALEMTPAFVGTLTKPIKHGPLQEARTVEAYITPRAKDAKSSNPKDLIPGRLCGFSDGGPFLDVGDTYLSASAFGLREYVNSRVRVMPNQRIHVAWVRQGKELRLYLDGKLQNKEQYVGPNFTPPEAEFMLGNRNNSSFSGAVSEIRISSSARYNADFTPQQRFETDDNTIALFHCDEGEGDLLKDSSGNGHHAKIVGAKWVKVETPAGAGG